jgi:hypothetical protein
MLGTTDDQERIEALDAELREIREAQEAARQVLHRLDTSRESLSSAGSWGIYDTRGGRPKRSRNPDVESLSSVWE